MTLKDFVVMCIERAEKICDDKDASPADKIEAVRLLNLAIKTIGDIIDKI